MSFDIKIIDGNLEVKNKSNKIYENCLVSLKNIFFDDLVFEKCNIGMNETKIIPMNELDFISTWSEKEYFLKIYSNDRLIFDKVINDKSKCFVLVSNQKYEELTIKLIEQLVELTDIDILHYTIGYETGYKNKQVNNIKIDISRDVDNPHYIQFTKPTAFLDAISKGYKDYVFLDSDIQVRRNISEIFDYAKYITDGPVLQRGCWDYSFVNGVYTPGVLTQKLIGFENQTSPYCLTNVVIFNSSHKSLFEEWKSVCDLKEVEEICKKEFLHDEILFNCILWKKNITPKLFWFFVNVSNLEDVKFIIDYRYDGYESNIDMNKHGKGYPFQSRFPYDKNNIFGFHCIKDLEEVDKVIDVFNNNQSFEDKLLGFYNNITKNDVSLNPDYESVSILNHYIGSPYIEIRSKLDKKFKVEFINSDGFCEYSTIIGSNMWTRASKKYFNEWNCRVWDGDELIHNEKYDANGKRVFITLESKSIGDTLAWFPYVDEFRKKWNCKVICSTFWNHLFRESYPEIEFVEPGAVVGNIYAMYNIGWFYNEDNTVQLDKNPTDFKQIPLGKTAADILGLDFEYVRAKIKLPQVEKKRRVGIAIHSTAQTKYWNNPTGWQEVVDFLKELGYEVMILSKEGDNYMGNKHPEGCTKLPEGSMEKLMETMLSCEFFIGVGSGLSWVSWTIGVPTFLISGFSKPISEFEGENVFRIFNDSVCNGCYNRYRLDAGDWNWCPDHKGTERQFECTKSITARMVIDKIMKSGLIRVPNLNEDVITQID